jgi:hypothetical protein
MDNKKIEELFNKTFSGLTLFYRDTELPDHLKELYQVGQILLERGMTDMTWKGGGLATNFRYLIASSFGKDLSMFNPDAGKFGLIVLTPNSYFKVLDIYKHNGKTQVFLLNIPGEGIDVFKSAKTNIEEEIIAKARQSFDEKVDAEPLSELQHEEWLDRTSFPIGMNEKGEFFHGQNKPQQTNKSFNSANQDKPKGFWKKLFG